MRETRLTKIGLIGCALILIAYFTVTDIVLADETVTVTDQDIAQLSVICAATNAFIAERSTGVSHDLLTIEANWWKEFAYSWYDVIGSVDLAIGGVTAELLDGGVGEQNLDVLDEISQACDLARDDIEDILED